MSGKGHGDAGSLARSIDDPVVVVDDGGRAVSWNDAAADAFDLASDRTDRPATGADGESSGGLPGPVAAALSDVLPGPGPDRPEDPAGEDGVASPDGTGGETADPGGETTDPSGEAVDPGEETADPGGGTTEPVGGTVVEVDHDGAVYECHVYPGEGRHTVVCHEATDRVRRREELERYETVLEYLPDPAYITAADGTFEFMNEATWDLYGYDRVDLSDAPVWASMALRQEDVEACREAIRDCLSDDPETGDWRTVDMVGFRADGERVHIENHQAILVEDGEFAGTFGTVYDVSDRHRERERLQVLDRVLRHNVRTEVSVLRGHAERIARSTDDPAVVESAEAVSDSVETLLGISEKTREAELALVGETERTAVNLAEATAAAVDRVRTDHPVAAFEVAVEDDLSVEAGPALPTALAELVENAVVHDDDPEPAVEVTADTDRANVGYVTDYLAPRDPIVVRIADDGPGIPEDERAVVAGDAEVSPLTHSEGLGLWTAAWIVQEYGGKLEIDDREGGGTVVEVHLVRAD